MLKKILRSIRNRTLMRDVAGRIRIAWRIKNKNVYADYLRQKTYYNLQKKYKSFINVRQDEPFSPSDRSHYIFTCWLQGYDHAPALVKACINAAARIEGNELVILTSDNYSDYVELPDFVIRKWEKGIIPNAHFTDILRTALIVKYGGCWFDSTLLFTGDHLPDYVLEAPLFLFQNVHLNRFDTQFLIPSNWFISGYRGEPILKLTYDLLIEYWRTHNRVINYHIYHIFFTLAAQKFAEEWKSVPVYSNQPCHVLQFEINDKYTPGRWKQLTGMTDFHKLNWRVATEADESSFYAKILAEYLQGSTTDEKNL